MRALQLMLLCGILMTSLANAAERSEFYNGVRALGMGGVQVPTVNDETALIVNPAGLGRLRNSFLTVADPELALGSKTQSIMGYQVTDFLDPQKVLDLINKGKDYGKHYYEGIKVFPSLVVPNFGVGLLAKYATDGEVDATGTTYTLNYTNDYAFLLGYNFNFWDGRIKLGFNFKAINHVVISQDVPANSTGLKIKSLAKEGLGLGSDVGLLLTAPWRWLPTLGAVWRDVGNTKYNFQDGLFYNTADRPDTTASSVDAGLSITPIVGKHSRITIGAELRDVLNYGKEEDKARLIHAGFEFNYHDFFFLRGGWNQRYWTGGVEFDVYNYQFQFADYGEEVGVPGDPQEDRRFVGKFAWRF